MKFSIKIEKIELFEHVKGKPFRPKANIVDSRLQHLNKPYSEFYDFKYLSTDDFQKSLFYENSFSEKSTINYLFKEWKLKRFRFNSYDCKKAFVLYSSNSIVYIDTKCKAQIIRLDSFHKLKKTAEILNIDISGIKLDNDMSFKEFFYRNINVLHHYLVDNTFFTQ